MGCCFSKRILSYTHFCYLRKHFVVGWARMACVNASNDASYFLSYQDFYLICVTKRFVDRNPFVNNHHCVSRCVCDP